MEVDSKAEYLVAKETVKGLCWVKLFGIFAVLNDMVIIPIMSALVFVYIIPLFNVDPYDEDTDTSICYCDDNSSQTNHQNHEYNYCICSWSSNKSYNTEFNFEHDGAEFIAILYLNLIGFDLLQIAVSILSILFYFFVGATNCIETLIEGITIHGIRLQSWYFKSLIILRLCNLILGIVLLVELTSALDCDCSQGGSINKNSSVWYLIEDANIILWIYLSCIVLFLFSPRILMCLIGNIETETDIIWLKLHWAIKSQDNAN